MDSGDFYGLDTHALFNECGFNQRWTTHLLCRPASIADTMCLCEELQVLRGGVAA